MSKDKKGINSDFVVGIFALILAGVVFFSTRELSRLGGVFVNYVLIALTALAVLVIGKGFLKPDHIRFFETTMERNNVLVGIVILLLYLVFLPIVGFLPASFVFYFCFNLYLADERFSTRNIVASALLTAVVVTAFYIVFHNFLEVPLPESIWS